MTIFDRIIAGQIPASFVWQDALCVVFLDINPMSRGHALVVPRQSVATLEELDAPVLAHLWQTATRIGAAQRHALGSAAQHFLVNDGKDASQSVPHVHIHVIPRYRGDRYATVSRMIWHLATFGRPSRGERAELRARLDADARAMAEALERSES
jgi:histidine triad (HIT) family protein